MCKLCQSSLAHLFYHQLGLFCQAEIEKYAKHMGLSTKPFLECFKKENTLGMSAELRGSCDFTAQTLSIEAFANIFHVCQFP